jgi:hypothetical protein
MRKCLLLSICEIATIFSYIKLYKYYELIGDIKKMKVKELLSSVKTHTPSQIAKKHGVSVEKILQQLKMGIDVEKEHTKDARLSMEIALDHLLELPDYYTRLKKMEQDAEENGEVIPSSKFEQRLRTKRGLLYNPDIADTAAELRKKGFVSFEAKPTDKNKPEKSWQIWGVLKNGEQKVISTTTKELARALAAAYSAGGYSKHHIQKVTLGRD